MVKKELRRMNRTELIEIIYALQQQEQSLVQQTEGLNSLKPDPAAHDKADEIIACAKEEASLIISSAKMEADRILEQGRKEAEAEKERFIKTASALLRKYPELAEAMKISDGGG